MCGGDIERALEAYFDCFEECAARGSTADREARRGAAAGEGAAPEPAADGAAEGLEERLAVRECYLLDLMCLPEGRGFFFFLRFQAQQCFVFLRRKQYAEPERGVVCAPRLIVLPHARRPTHDMWQNHY